MALGTKGGGISLALRHILSRWKTKKRICEKCLSTMFTVANFLSRSQQQQQTKGRRDFPLLHILFLACFFSFQLSRISRLFQNDEKENLKDFRARTIQKFTKEGIPNFLKIKKFASPIISRLSFYGEVLKTTHTHSRTSTHTHTRRRQKKKKRELCHEMVPST